MAFKTLAVFAFLVGTIGIGLTALPNILYMLGVAPPQGLVYLGQYMNQSVALVVGSLIAMAIHDRPRQ